MKLDFRQRLLTTTLFVGAGMLATPAFAQATPPENPADTSQGTGAQPETTNPPEGTVTPPSQDAQGAPTTGTQEIIVTGSRIPQPNLQTASPVTTVSSQEVKLSGATRTEDLLNSLPQVFSDQGSNVSNGATGTAEVNLRGLGTKRTMVLINGKRMVGGDPTDPSPDINFIPIQLVKRVDVLTGGASAVYGADAVAGVVNFIMDDTFTGFRVDGQASVFNHHQHMGPELQRPNDDAGFLVPHGMSTNGGAQDIAAIMGAAFDDGRGHVQAYATYRTQDPVLESTRDFSFCALGAFAPQYVAAYGEYYCGGSTTSATGTFNVFNPTTGSRIKRFHVEDHAFLPGATPFNYAPYNYFQRPDERYTLGAFADYEISPAFKPYLQVMFMHDHSDALIAPSGDFSNTSRINCDNPLMTDTQRSQVCITPVFDPRDANPTEFDKNGNPIYHSNFGSLVGATAIFNTAPGAPQLCSDPADPTTCRFIGIIGFNPATVFPGGFTQAIMTIGRRNVEGGGRDDVLDHQSYRIVGGMRGDIARGISYDASYQYSRASLEDAHFNDFSLVRLTRALDVVSVLNGAIVAPGTAGATIQCRSVFDGTDPNCVPYNIFQSGGVTQEALGYLQVPGFVSGYVGQTIAEANVTMTGADYGLQTPWADTGVGIAIGADYMKNKLVFTPDIENQTGDLTGNGSTTPPVQGQLDVRELYGEIQIPIVAHNFIDLLQLSAGYRLSNYHIADNSFNTNTYKIEGEFAPIADVRFRGSYNRAVRAPNINELFSPTQIALSGTADPCEGTTPTATLDQCLNTGISAGQYGGIPENTAHQYGGFLGGNLNLSPEKADTWTAGVVVQPRFVPGLALTVDYYNIKVKGLIGTLGFSTVMNQCLSTGDPFFCNLIHRDQFGTLWLQPNGFIVLTNTNVGGLQTKGFDFQASYNRRLGGIGTLNVSFVGSLLRHLITNPFGDITYDCAGLYGPTCSTSANSASPNPKWRHKLRAGITMPNGIGISGQWRYFKSTELDTLSDDPDLNGGAGPNGAPGNNHMDARSYFDLAFTARMAQKLNLRLGVNNIFDKDPPVQGLALGNGNTFPQMYDSMGRYLFAGFTVDF